MMTAAHPAATSEQVRKARCPFPEREGEIRFAATALVGLMARVAGWRPDDFWMATPADVRAVLAGWGDADAEASFDGAGLAAMMERFPDG